MVCIIGGTGYYDEEELAKGIISGHIEHVQIVKNNKEHSYFNNNRVVHKFEAMALVKNRKPHNAPKQGRNY